MDHKRNRVLAEVSIRMFPLSAFLGNAFPVSRRNTNRTASRKSSQFRSRKINEIQFCAFEAHKLNSFSASEGGEEAGETH